MKAFLVSESAVIGNRVRQVLLQEGWECPNSSVAGLDRASQRLAEVLPDLVVIVLTPNPELALNELTFLKDQGRRRVLAVGPASEPKLMLRALRGGADDYVDEAELEAELVAALARWQGEHSAQENAGRLIAVLAPSGGSGSSTLAANVATVLAKHHEKAALVDMKLEQGDLAALLDLKPTYTLADLCLNVTRVDRTFFERTLVRHDSGVHLLAPPRMLADIGRVTSDGVRQALSMARAIFPYVVVDLDHSFRDEQMQVLRQADIILLVLRLDFASLRNTRRTLDHLEHEGIARDRIRLVVNRYGQPKEVPASKAEEALGMKMFHYVPDDPKSVNRANNNGVPVVLEAPSAKVSRSVTKLADSVNGRHHTSH